MRATGRPDNFEWLYDDMPRVRHHGWNSMTSPRALLRTGAHHGVGATLGTKAAEQSESGCRHGVWTCINYVDDDDGALFSRRVFWKAAQIGEVVASG